MPEHFGMDDMFPSPLGDIFLTEFPNIRYPIYPIDEFSSHQGIIF